MNKQHTIDSYAQSNGRWRVGDRVHVSLFHCKGRTETTPRNLSRHQNYFKQNLLHFKVPKSLGLPFWTRQNVVPRHFL